MTTENRRTQLMLAFGGESSEHDVSVTSARNVHDALDRQKYQIHLAYITPEGEWLLVESIESTVGDALLPVLGQGKFRTTAGSEIVVDALLPILHGRNGEDGTVQGMARLLHVPCVGPGLIGSAIAMDKDITKRLLRDGGVPVVDWVTWLTHDQAPEYEAAAQELGSKTLFVKPANAGSSVGVSRASSAKEFTQALRLAAEHDTIVLIEPAVVAREIELAVLGTENPRAATPGEVIPGAEFYSYEDKYAADSQSAYQIPAQLNAATVERLQAYALEAYRLTRGEGMARIDFFLTVDGQIYLNEINTIPGFTHISMYPKMWQHEGMGCSELIDALIADAILKVQ